MKNNIPAFGGVASLQQDILPKQYGQLDKIWENSNLQLFLSNTKTCRKWCTISVRHMVWGPSNSQMLGKEKLLKSDEKFLMVNITDTSIEIFNDHYAKIPLFYVYDQGVLFFGSSLEVVKVLLDEKLTLNPSGLLFYYAFGFNSYDTFLLNKVKVLPGGTKLEISKDGLTHSKYFNDLPDNLTNNRSITDNADYIDEYLYRGVKQRCSGYSKIAVALSGGVDSGYLTQKIIESGHQVKAYTLGFENNYDEFGRIDTLSKLLNFEYEKIQISPENIIKNYLEVSTHSSIPVSFNNSILNFIYQRASDDGAEILFDGDGADRLYLGMNQYLLLQNFLKYYEWLKKINLHQLLPKTIDLFALKRFEKMSFHIKKKNLGIPFYGERQIHSGFPFEKDFELRLNALALGSDLEAFAQTANEWDFFKRFSIYYTPTFFFFTPYELQLQKGIVSEPGFWSDAMVKHAYTLPLNQQLTQKKTKMVLRLAAQKKIADDYWNLPKIGLQNSYSFLKASKIGNEFIQDHKSDLKKSEIFQIIQTITPSHTINLDQLIPLYIWWLSQNKN